jgi:large subunit ribosomal protein L10
MAKSKDQKNKDLDELTSKIKEARSVVFTGYTGTTVKDLDKFRKTLRKENVFSKVYKITLVKKALEANGISASGIDYKTPVILSVSNEEETAPARVIKALSKDLKTFSVLEGIVDGKLISKAEVAALADLPSKDQLRAQVIATINAPVTGFVNVLAGNLRGLINVLNAAAQKA